MDTAIIDEYTESMKRGDSFPAVVVFKVGEDCFLVDGYHRYLAVQGAKFDKILADVRIGTMRDAVLFSAGVNATHGIRRTNEDKRRAVLTLLRDKEWKDWADTKIAATCNVSVDLVAAVRKSILGETDRCRLKKSKVERGGKVYKMDTSKIGKSKQPGPGPAKEPEKDRVADASKSITEEAPAVPAQPSLAAQVAGTVPPEPPIHRPPPCLGGGGCERGKFRSDKVRGNVCDAIGAPINQLPGNMCPYDIKLARKSESAFVPASQLATANKDPGIPGGKPAIPDRTLTITFSPDQWAILGKLQKAGMADGYDGAVLFCVDEIGNRSE